MIISRREFYRRNSLFEFTLIKEVDELMSVEKLFTEIQADAPFRNHNYMFDEKLDLSKLELQEETVGIKNKHPDIKTEGERIDHIRKEFLDDSYEPIPVKVDIDYPCVIHLEDGFHRVFVAHSLGLKWVRVRAMYGKFVLGKSISLGELVSLLDMLEKLFGLKKIGEMKGLIEKSIKKKPHLAEMFSISYGNETDVKSKRSTD